MTSFRTPAGQEPAVSVTVDGEAVTAHPGQTVAAVLLGLGRTTWRSTRTGRPRGVFCGIGACFDCLVVVDGVSDVRACQRIVADGTAITTDQPCRSLDANGRPPTARGVQLTDRPPPVIGKAEQGVVVVGAGPAGMHAALAAADAGVDVLLVDSAPAIGGQYYRHPPDEPGTPAIATLRGRIEAHARIEHVGETSVWAVEPGPRLHLQTGPADAPGRRTGVVHAAAVVIATGAYDRVLPFPGWVLPGVFTAGAAQALAKGQRIAVGERVLVAGTGPFLLPVAESLLGAGAQVVAVLEASAATRSARAWARHPQAIVAQGNKLGELGHYARVLARHRVPYRTRTTVVEAHGTDRIEAVTTARLDPDWREIPGTRRRIAVDALAVGHGFTPQLEVALAAGCRTEGDFVAVDGRQATSADGVFAAGEITGIGGAVLAAAEGTLAGLAAAAHLGAPVPDLAIDKAVRRVRRARVFATTLAAAYPTGAGWRDRVAADTLVCRCEDVPHAALAAAVTDRGATGARSLKLICRAGLGPCQGRVCGRNVTDLADTLLTAAGRPPLTDRQATARRPIVTPIRLGDLAAAHDEEENP